MVTNLIVKTGLGALSSGMFYLCLSIISSVVIAVILKVSEERSGERLVLFGANYIVASGFSLFFWWKGGFYPLSATALLLGAIGGVLFIVTFVVMIVAVGSLGMAIPVSVTRIAVLLPVILSIMLYEEVPGIAQIIGIILVLPAVALFGLTASKSHPVGKVSFRSWILPLGLFFLMGSCEIIFKIFQETCSREEKSGFLFVVFTVALILTWGAILIKRYRVEPSSFTLGLILGVPNMFASFFFVTALRFIPGMIAFPLNDISVVLLSALAGKLFWRERFTVATRWAIFLAVMAIIFMNGGNL